MNNKEISNINTYFNNVVNNDNFINSVRRASVTLNDRSSISDDVIKDTAIYDSFPRVMLRLATTKDKDGNPLFKGIGYGVNYEEQQEVIYKVLINEPFSSGLIRVVAMFTAAKLIRSIPLNSDMKFLDSSKFIEEQAIEDLNNILGILMDKPNIVDVLTKSSQSFSLFFSQELDYNSIPPYVFDQVEEDIAYLEGIQLHDSIKVSNNHFSFIHLYMSNGNNVLETEIPIRHGADISEVINDIANTINKSSNFNLIASISINPTIKTSIKYSKKELYYGTTENPHKEITSYIYPNIHRLDIVSKSISVNTYKELISISSITKDKNGIIVGGVTGLVHGNINNYKNLTSKGPHSLLIEVKTDTSLKVVENVDTQNIDTFHFKYKKGYIHIGNGNILIRISNLPDTSYPTQWNIDISEGLDISQVVNKIHDSFYKRRSNTQITTSINNINTIQIIPFVLCQKEVRIVVDILNLPEGIEVASGDVLKVITSYGTSRSISIKSQLDYVNYARLTDTTNKNKPASISAVVPPKHSDLYKDMKKRLSKLNKEGYIC